jgi:circadian clock protein KaiB
MPQSGKKKPSLVLRLYVAGNAPNSVRAISNAQAVCNEHFAARYELEIVDLLEYPLRGLTDGVIVTPTLIRLLPLPVQKVIGTLSDTGRLLLVLAGE